jgi:hypothetical protein
MRFGAIDPRTTQVEFVDAADLDEAKKIVGLDPLRIDHGVLWRDFRTGGTAIVVYEFGFYLPRDRARYFAIGRSLFVGSAVVYAFDATGETVDLRELPAVFFFRDADEVERAIGTGQIVRPMMAINDQIVWRWPEPTSDPEIVRRMREHGTWMT